MNVHKPYQIFHETLGAWNPSNMGRPQLEVDALANLKNLSAKYCRVPIEAASANWNSQSKLPLNGSLMRKSRYSE